MGGMEGRRLPALAVLLNSPSASICVHLRFHVPTGKIEIAAEEIEIRKSLGDY
jgi:hypothetical protein